MTGDGRAGAGRSRTICVMKLRQLYDRRHAKASVPDEKEKLADELVRAQTVERARGGIGKAHPGGMDMLRQMHALRSCVPDTAGTLGGCPRAATPAEGTVSPRTAPSQKPQRLMLSVSGSVIGIAPARSMCSG